MGIPRSAPTLITFSLSIAFLGCLYGLWLRKPMIVQGNYPFPEGTTTYNTIRAMYAKGEASTRKAAVLLRWFAGSFLFAVAKYFLPIASSVSANNNNWNHTNHINQLVK
jgi:uncharacterized oligopeptide transporter (OPT) family protein